MLFSLEVKTLNVSEAIDFVNISVMYFIYVQVFLKKYSTYSENQKTLDEEDEFRLKILL